MSRATSKSPSGIKAQVGIFAETMVSSRKQSSIRLLLLWILITPAVFKIHTTGEASGTWIDGVGLNNFEVEAAPYSQLAAALIAGEGPNDLRIHLYYQDTTNRLCEQIWNGGWANGCNNLPVALTGTSLSSFALASNPGRWWLYYQDDKLKLKEIIYMNGQYINRTYNPTGTFRPGASVSAVAWGQKEIRVYSINEQNELIQTAFNGREWCDTVTMVHWHHYSGLRCCSYPMGPCSDQSLPL
ncbi:hypothetical protein RUND412_010269 [Rhizina undulata]